MPLAVVSTIVRRTPPDEHSSFLYVVDLDEGEVVEAIPVPESSLRAADPNPRGGLRGTRGVSATAERLAIATWNRIHVLDADWTVRGEISHPWLGGIHDILAEEDGVWVSATAVDVLAKVGWDGEITRSWYWGDDPALARAVGYPKAPSFDSSLDFRSRFPGITEHNRVHLNAVVRSRRGLLLSFGQIVPPSERRRRRLRGGVARAGSRTPLLRPLVNRIRTRRAQSGSDGAPVVGTKSSTYAIVELELDADDVPGRSRLVLERPTFAPNHNLLTRGETIYFNDSDAGRLLAIDPADGRIVSEIGTPGDPPFARGLCSLTEDQVLVGGQRPAALHRLDLNGERVESSVTLSSRPTETVYAVELLPAGFSRDAVTSPPGWADVAAAGRQRIA